MKRAELEKIITEEIYKYLEEREKRPGIGKNKKGKYTSAGTVPTERGRKMSSSQVTKREEVGRKLLNLWRRGGKEGDRFREAVKRYAQKNDISIAGDRKKVYSIIWAIASGKVLKGGA